MKFYYHGTLIYKNTKLPKLFSYYKCYTLNPDLLFQNKTTFLSLTYKRANLQLLFFCPYCKILSKAFDLSYRGVWVFRLLHAQHLFHLLSQSRVTFSEDSQLMLNDEILGILNVTGNDSGYSMLLIFLQHMIL